MMTEKPLDEIENLPPTFNITEVESLILSAEHAVIIADDLAQWALEARGGDDSASRWRAVAETRRMANDRWQAAARKIRSELS
jgi:hypothetical protein